MTFKTIKQHKQCCDGKHRLCRAKIQVLEEIVELIKELPKSNKADFSGNENQPLFKQAVSVEDLLNKIEGE